MTHGYIFSSCQNIYLLNPFNIGISRIANKCVTFLSILRNRNNICLKPKQLFQNGGHCKFTQKHFLQARVTQHFFFCRLLCIFTASPNHPGDYYKHNQIKHYICYASLVCSSLCVLCIPVETFVDSTYFSPLLSSKSEKNGLIQDMLTLMTFMNTKIKFKNGIKTTGTFLWC